ncbi:hypothetical protein [Yoonia sp.]|uniref:hypothetical protein n=1 Tax=Yoonia sp. TaxID=2212373 RepID=UPI00391A4946
MRQKTVKLWHIQRVRRLVRDKVQLGAHCLINVTEIMCTDPDCPGPATQITVTGFDLVRRIFVIHRPAAAITAADLDCLIG